MLDVLFMGDIYTGYIALLYETSHNETRVVWYFLVNSIQLCDMHF